MPLMSQRVHSAQLKSEKRKKKTEVESKFAEKVSCQMRMCKTEYSWMSAKMKEHHTPKHHTMATCSIFFILRLLHAFRQVHSALQICTKNENKHIELVGEGINFSYRVKSRKEATQKSTHYCILWRPMGWRTGCNHARSHNSDEAE